MSPAQRMNPAAATWAANPALGARICDEPGSLAAPASIAFAVKPTPDFACCLMLGKSTPMRLKIACLACIAVVPAALSATAGEKVVLRGPGDKLLHPAEHGTLHAESFIPAARETFELLRLDKQQVALKASDGRWLLADPRNGCTPQLDRGPAPPTNALFELVPFGPGRTALRSLSSGSLLVVAAGTGRPRNSRRRPPGRRRRERSRFFTSASCRRLSKPPFRRYSTS